MNIKKKVVEAGLDLLTYKVVAFIASFFLLWWIICALRGSSEGMMSLDLEHISSTGMVFLVLSIVVVLLLFMSAKFRKLGISIAEKINGLKWMGLVLLFVFQFSVITAFGAVDYGWDPRMLIPDSRINVSDIDFYFSLYPNNRFLGTIFYSISFLFGITDSYVLTSFVLNVFTCLLLDSSIIIIYCTFRKKSELIASYSFWLLFCLFGFSGFFLIPYSDVYSFFASSVCMYFVISAIQNSKDNKLISYVQFFIFGGFTYISYLIKPSSIIPQIALVFLLFFLLLRKSAVSIFVVFLIVLSGMAVTYIPWTLYENHQDLYSFDDSKAMPMTHFVMMGLTGDGGYNQADYEGTLSHDTHQEKVAYNIEQISNRIDEFGLSLPFFLMKKANNFMADGSFGWGVEGGFLVEHTTNDMPRAFQMFHDLSVSNFLRQLYTPGTGINASLRVFEQAIYILCIFFALVYALSSFAKSFSDNCDDIYYSIFMYIAIIGIVLFLLLFESGRSRYLIQYLPCLTMFSSFGFRTFLHWVKNGLNIFSIAQDFGHSLR